MIDIASRAVVQVGFPVVVAGVLLWFLLHTFQNNMDTITTRMQANADSVRAFTEQQRAGVSELVAQTHELQQQSGHLAEQTAILKGIAQDIMRLTELRRLELDRKQQEPGH